MFCWTVFFFSKHQNKIFEHLLYSYIPLYKKLTINFHLTFSLSLLIYRECDANVTKYIKNVYRICLFSVFFFQFLKFLFFSCFLVTTSVVTLGSFMNGCIIKHTIKSFFFLFSFFWAASYEKIISFHRSIKWSMTCVTSHGYLFVQTTNKYLLFVISYFFFLQFIYLICLIYFSELHPILWKSEANFILTLQMKISKYKNIVWKENGILTTNEVTHKLTNQSSK